MRERAARGVQQQHRQSAMAKEHLTEVGQLGVLGGGRLLLPRLKSGSGSVVEGLLSCQVHNRGGPLGHGR